MGLTFSLETTSPSPLPVASIFCDSIIYAYMQSIVTKGSMKLSL